MQAAAPCSPAENGMISPLYSTPLSVISLLPCFSLQLFEETQEVCRNVHSQLAVYSPQGIAQTTAEL